MFVVEIYSSYAIKDGGCVLELNIINGYIIHCWYRCIFWYTAATIKISLVHPSNKLFWNGGPDVSKARQAIKISVKSIHE